MNFKANNIVTKYIELKGQKKCLLVIFLIGLLFVGSLEKSYAYNEFASKSSNESISKTTNSDKTVVREFPLAKVRDIFKQYDTVSSNNEIIFNFSGFSSNIIYTGKSRSIPKKKKNILRLFFNYYKFDKSFIDLYDKEIEVIEGDRSFWLPIQNQILLELNEVVKPHQQFQAFIRELGWVTGKFAINQKDLSTQHEQQKLTDLKYPKQYLVDGEELILLMIHFKEM